MNRNVNDFFTKTPTPHFPRNRFDMGVHKKLFTTQHGRLTPFYCRMVYPGDTWSDNPVPFVRMDTSLRVPLDDIFLDTYFFFVPFRILDDGFAKVLGEVEPYDTTQYSIPQLTIDSSQGAGLTLPSLNILEYLGYCQASATAGAGGYFLPYVDDVTAYPLAAYYKIWNDWFRDENLDPSIPYEDLYNTTYRSLDQTVFNKLSLMKVNRYHDYFSSATISPQKGPAVTIPLGASAPITTVSTSGLDISGLSGEGLYWATVSSGNNVIDTSTSVKPLVKDTDGSLKMGNTTTSRDADRPYFPANLAADLSQAAGTINELRLSFAIQSLYERRNRFGTRYIETIRGQWGIEVPDSFFQRPEYLGGSRVTLNNVPVLSTENSSQLGQMSGNSATLGGSNSFSKTFIEYGVIIGLCCTRIHHSYGQGKKKEIWSLKTGLDLYNPVFANIGFQPVMRNEIYNQGNSDTAVFAYQEAWSELRMEMDEYKGLFGNLSANTEIKNKWHYGDYYAAAPSFSAAWMKEDDANVYRTLTGNLINGAGASDGQQFMIAYYVHPKVTRILPAHSVPVELIGRL